MLKPAARLRPLPPSLPVHTALQCEPTVTCEGYTFQIRKAPKTTSQGDSGDGDNRVFGLHCDLVTLDEESEYCLQHQAGTSML